MKDLFIKHTGHCYTIKNQNGLNNALYDYFNATDDGNNSTRSKKSVRELVNDIPKYYPITMVIVDLTFECNRLYIEYFDIDEASHMI
jgi:hypothetical protein